MTVAGGQYPQSKVGLVVLRFCQSQFKQEQLICAGCLMMAGIERWESHECNKLGQLRKDSSVYKKRIVEKGNRPKGEKIVQTSVAVREVMVETWKYDNEDFVFVFRNEAIVDVQRREKHSCTYCASRSACCFGYVSKLTP